MMAIRTGYFFQGFKFFLSSLSFASKNSRWYLKNILLEGNLLSKSSYILNNIVKQGIIVPSGFQHALLWLISRRYANAVESECKHVQ